ncbi:MAG: metallophosphoesterase [Desulfonatronovibrionaceae bacterium]
MFALTVVSVFLGMHLFAWTRLQRQVHFPWRIFWFGTALCLPLSLSIIYGYLVPDTWPAWTIRAVWQTTYFWVGFVLYIFSVQTTALVLETGLRVLRPALLCKAKTWLGTASVPISLLLLSTGYYLAASPPEITRYSVHTPKLEKPFTLALVADNHLGIQTRLSETKDIAYILNQEKPEVCLFAGDLFNDHPGFLDQHLKIFRDLDLPRGKYGILGNHEVYFGRKKAVRLMKKAGIRPVRNTVFSLPGVPVQIAGIDDPARHGDNKDFYARIMQEVLAGADPERFTILVTHRPEGLLPAADLGVDLQLSGHTHNGQLFPFNLLVRTAYPHIYGQYREKGTVLIVTRGAGTWGPSARFPHRREIVIIDILPEAKEAKQ